MPRLSAEILSQDSDFSFPEIRLLSPTDNSPPPMPMFASRACSQETDFSLPDLSALSQPEPTASPTPTTKLHKDFEIRQELGSGRFSTVYRVYHKIDGQEYAIKETTVDLELRGYESSQRKTRWAAMGVCPHIVRYFDAWTEGVDASRLFLRTELCEKNLNQVMISRGTPLDTPSALTVLEHCCKGLAYLHESAVTHGDIKPTNILRVRRPLGHRQSGDDDPWIFKIGDVGLADLGAGANLERSDARYASKILQIWEAEASDDVFSLAAVVLEATAGLRLPASGEPEWLVIREQLQRSTAFQKMHELDLIPELLLSMMKPAKRPTAAAILEGNAILTVKCKKLEQEVRAAKVRRVSGCIRSKTVG